MKQAGQIVNTLSYKQKLQRPESKSFRRSMRDTKGDFCHCCKASGPSGDNQTNPARLELHHVFYDATREPWEYGADEMVLLCETCHKGLHEQLQNFRRFVFGKLTPQSLKVINGALVVGLDIHNPLLFAHAFAEFVSNPQLVERYAASFACSEPKPVTSDDVPG